MVSRLQAKAVVLTESCGVTLEAGEALSGLLGLVTGGLDSSPAAAGACFYSACSEAAAPRSGLGICLAVALPGQGAFPAGFCGHSCLLFSTVCCYK